MKNNSFSKFSAFPGLSIGPVQNYRFELSKVDNDRWPRMTFYDILMKIGRNFIDGFWYVLKLFIRCLKAPRTLDYDILELFFIGVEILALQLIFDSLKLGFCGFYSQVYLYSWAIEQSSFSESPSRKKRLNYESFLQFMKSMHWNVICIITI